MAELFVEIFGEEIPARMLAGGQQQLRRALEEALSDAGLPVSGEIETYATPRRLVVVAEVPERTADTVVEYKGPRVGAPEAAIAGFLRRSGLARIEDADQIDGKKGAYYLARVSQPGGAAGEVLSEVMPEVLGRVRWPKSMRWGDSGGKRWVRPVRSIICLVDGVVVDFEFAGVRTGKETRGHRVMGSPEPFVVANFADYRKKLEKSKVVLDTDKRMQLIRDGLEKEARSGFAVIEDEELLAEVAGLVEWPVVLRGGFDREYLDLPDIIIRQAMRQHQKYFAVRRQDGGALAPYFLVVANQEGADEGEAIRSGNERVLAARLADAKFFWEKDCQTGIDAMAKKVKSSVFLRLPRQGDIFVFLMEPKLQDVERVALRLVDTCMEISEEDREQARTDVREAVRLCKADLESATVGEFPALEGRVGRLLAERAGKSEAVCRAIEEHYRPRNPDDDVPIAKTVRLSKHDNGHKDVDWDDCKKIKKMTEEGWEEVDLYNDPKKLPVIFLSLSDKMNYLSVLLKYNEYPTGRSDRFGMRRVALSIARILTENDISGLDFPIEGNQIDGNTSLREYIKESSDKSLFVKVEGKEKMEKKNFMALEHREMDLRLLPGKFASMFGGDKVKIVANRYKEWLAEKGPNKTVGPVGNDIIEAAFSVNNSFKRNTYLISCLKRFLEERYSSEEESTRDRSDKLVSAFKRVSNIARDYEGSEIVPNKLKEKEEQALYSSLKEYKKNIQDVGNEHRDHCEIMYYYGEPYVRLCCMADCLPDSINAFMDNVRVNDAPEPLRTNRLALLAAVRDAIKDVADLSKLQS